MKLYRLLLWLAAWLPATLSAQTQSLESIIKEVGVHSTATPPPNIIVIQCHGLGYGDLSCYGQTNFQTAVLDQLAKEGARCMNYSGGTNFTATLTALMTGKNAALASAAPTLAERLQQAGYHTGLIGEWTLGEKPWTQGFDEFAGFVNGEDGKNYYSDFLWRYAPKSIITESNTLENYVGKETIYPNTGGKKGQFLPDLLFAAAGNFIRIHKPDQFNHFTPFFLLVNLPAPRTAKTGADDFPAPTDAPFTSEPWPQAAKNRAALIARLDAGVGKLREQMNKYAATNNVVIFFTSAAAPEPFADKKMNFLKPNGAATAEAGSAPRLPMIVWWPDKIAGGKTSDRAWNPCDFTATVLELARVKSTTALEGASIVPVLTGKTP